MIEYSIILPCYNEMENLKALLNGFSLFITHDNIELILVDNGSYDGTSSLKDELLQEYPFLRWIRIEKNIGYGYGIYTGMLQAQGRYIGYTHADMQTDPADMKKAIELIKLYKKDKPIFIKGSRKGRKYFDRIFSRGLELFVAIILKQNLREINAQPTLFSREVLQGLTDPPLHWGFDLYVYYMARNMGAEIKRLDVLFPDRAFGRSKWNKGFWSRMNLSIKMLRYCLKLQKKTYKYLLV
jgi:polyisoprenyl-phosphate glycosyltransferase